MGGKRDKVFPAHSWTPSFPGTLGQTLRVREWGYWEMTGQKASLCHATDSRVKEAWTMKYGASGLSILMCMKNVQIGTRDTLAAKM